METRALAIATEYADALEERELIAEHGGRPTTDDAELDRLGRAFHAAIDAEYEEGARISPAAPS